MKSTTILYIALSLVAMAGVAGCRRDKPLETAWHTESVARNDIYNKVRLNYPVVSGGALADSVNSAVAELLCEGLFDESPAHHLSVEACLDTLLEQKRRDEAAAQVPYEFQSKGSVFQYRPAGVTTLEIEMYRYTGGAHGLTTTVLDNFDSESGAKLSLTEIFTDTARLSVLNREAFTGYLDSLELDDADELLFVSPDSISLPENVGFGPGGVEMLYNQYEIAAYVFGQSRYVIPYDKIADILIIKE